MTAELVARQWRNELGAPHTRQARDRNELIELPTCALCGISYGFADYHQRRDGQITIYQIAVSSQHPLLGYGRQLLRAVIAACPGATSVLAKCPSDLAANAWYARLGFVLLATEPARTGRALNVWRLQL